MRRGLAAFDQQPSSVGRFRKTRQYYQAAAQLAEQRGLLECVAIERAWAALMDAQVGFCGNMGARTSRALSLSREVSVLQNSATALAHCGRIDQAETLALELAQGHQLSTYVNEFLLPDLRAFVQTLRGHHHRALDFLQPLARYDRTALGVRSIYLRGLARLGLGDSRAAVKEFAKILDGRRSKG